MGVLGCDSVYCGHRIAAAASDRFLLCRGSTEYDAGRARGVESILQDGVVAAGEVTSPLLEMTTALQRDTSCRPLLADIDMSMTSRPVVVSGDRLWTTSGGSDVRLCNVSATGIIQSRKIPTSLGTSGFLLIIGFGSTCCLFKLSMK